MTALIKCFDILETYEIRANNMIQSYLNNRQYVYMTKWSNMLFMRKGVTQRSIQGPLLFIIYKNKLPTLKREKEIQMIQIARVIGQVQL